MELIRSIIATGIPILVVLLGFGLAMAILLRWKSKKAREQRREPFTTDFLSVPGESCDEKIQELNAEFDIYAALVATGPVIVFAIAVSQAHFGGVELTIWHFVFFVLIGIAATVYCTRKLVQIDDARRKLVLGRQGELATAQELPGWKIERVGRRDRSSAIGTLVINPRTPDQYFVHPNRQLLDGKLIQRAAHQIETLCRKTEAAEGT